MNENEPDIAESLGDLERQAFLAVREAGQAQVNDVLVRLGKDGRELAYTTVMTVLARLWDKGFLVRRRDGKAYVYEARDGAEIAGELGGRAFREALERYGAPALLGFVRNLSPEQRSVVARLLEDGAATAEDNDGRSSDDAE